MKVINRALKKKNVGGSREKPSFLMFMWKLD